MIPESIKYKDLGYQESCATVLDAQASDFVSGLGKLHVPAATIKNQRLTEGMLVHIEPEIFIQTHGSTHFILPDEEFTVGAGDCCLIPRHIPHAENITPDENGQFCNLVILPTAEDSLILHFGVDSVKGYPKIGSLRENFSFEREQWGPDFLDKLIKDSYSTTQVDTVILRSGITIFFSWLAKLLRNSEPKQDRNQQPLMVRCRQFIEKELHNPNLCIPMIAEDCACSPNHLSASFHKNYKVKLIDYINSLRIVKAEQLLEKSTLNISEISYACGFRDPTYFSRIFKKKSGYTPRRYRILHP